MHYVTNYSIKIVGFGGNHVEFYTSPIVIITLAITKRNMISFLEVRHVCSEHSWLIIQFSFDCLI